jgi:hypothetical protein
MKVRFLTEPEEVAARWEQVAPLLAPALQHAVLGELTLDDVRELALARRMIIGVFDDGAEPMMAMAFEFKNYPRIMTINIVALGGSQFHRFVGRFFEQFKAWAATAGAQHIEASCRPAMSRLLKRHGFANAYEKVSVAV